VVGLLVVALVAAGCGAAKKSAPRARQTVAGVTFLPASAAVRHECQRAANRLGYPIPCPTMLPQGLRPTPPQHGCHFAVVAAADEQVSCPSPRWHGWMFGSSQVQAPLQPPTQHLVLQAAPQVVDPTRAIDGAVPPDQGYPIRPMGATRMDGRRMHWYLVPPNHGSAFAGHLVLVWNAYGHTYAYGFHVLDTLDHVRAFDLELVRHLLTVYPRSGA